MDSTLSIYISGDKLDMFEDEKVNFVAKATDLQDISKVFMDFTQTFSVPASSLNNYIFQHYYEADLDGTFNANIRIDAYLEIGTLPFRTGKIQLEEIKMNNNQPEFYKLTFYGDLKKLSDSFGDDKLTDLGFIEGVSSGTTDTGFYDDNTSLNYYNHTYTAGNVVSGLQFPLWTESGRTVGESVMYPMISNQRLWRVGTGAAEDPGLTGQKMDITTTDGAILYGEFKPALRIIRLIEAIEEKYNITFSRDFFNTSAFQDLYMWLSNTSGPMNAFGDRQLINLTSSPTTVPNFTANTSTDTITFTANPYVAGTTPNYKYSVVMIVTPNSGFNNVPYNMVMTINGEDRVLVEGVTGEKQIIFTVNSTDVAIATNFAAQLFIQSSQYFNYTAKVEMIRANTGNGDVNFTLVSNTASPTNGYVRIVAQLPDIKVIDWLGGIIKMFNLIIRPISPTEFRVSTLNDFYAGGQIHEVNEYIDIDQIIISRPKLNKIVSFKYEKSNNILATNFRNTFGGIEEVGYGDLRAEYQIDSKDSLEIKIPFENMLFERQLDFSPASTATTTTNIITGEAISIDYKSNNVKPTLFYNNGTVKLSEPIKVKDSVTNSIGNVNYLYVIGNENNTEINQISDTINFGVEISPWSTQAVSNGLYNNYWDNYIANIYNPKQRKYSMSANLPINIMQNISLDDRLNIKDKQYRINDYELNLLDGSVKLNLVGNYYDEPFAIVNEGIDKTSFTTNFGTIRFDIIIDTNTTWATSKTSLVGSGTTWVTLSQDSGVGKTKVTVTVAFNGNGTSSSQRTLRLRFTTNGNNYDCIITQDGLII